MKRIGVVVLTVLLLSLFISVTATAGDKSILDVVKEKGVVRIGSGNATPPMNYIDEKGNWVGFDVDIGEEIAKKLGVKIERVLVDNKTRIAFLANGAIDISLANISQTRSREEQMDYAEPPYFWTGKIFYAKKGKFKSFKDLGGKKIGVDQGSNAFIAAPQELAKYSKKAPVMLSFQNSAEGFMALKLGKIDAYSQDAQIMAAVAGDIGVNFEAVGPMYSPGLYGIGVPPNDSKWRDKISFILQDMLKDGTYENIYQKWFGTKGKFPLPINARPRLPKDTYGDMLYVWPD
ncbi:MAG: transporter substrate-binding domain-containing protein [Nitrospirae bacterium]|nr:transporter substrate-binding domain-containing protein [Nitrospirota bacterium]